MRLFLGAVSQQQYASAHNGDMYADAIASSVINGVRYANALMYSSGSGYSTAIDSNLYLTAQMDSNGEATSTITGTLSGVAEPTTAILYKAYGADQGLSQSTITNPTLDIGAAFSGRIVAILWQSKLSKTSTTTVTLNGASTSQPINVSLTANFGIAYGLVNTGTTVNLLMSADAGGAKYNDYVYHAVVLSGYNSTHVSANYGNASSPLSLTDKGDGVIAAHQNQGTPALVTGEWNTGLVPVVTAHHNGASAGVYQTLGFYSGDVLNGYNIEYSLSPWYITAISFSGTG